MLYPVGAFCPPLEKQLAMRWRMGVRNSAHALARLATPFGEGEALRLSSVCRIRNMFPGGELLSRDRWPRAADAWYRGRSVRQPAALSEISLIDEQGVRVLYERQTEMAAEAVVLPDLRRP